MIRPHVILLVILPLVGYLLGSVPFGLLIGLAKGVDIRKAGSGNIGATNLGRVLGKPYFFYAFFLDALKALVPVLVASNLARHWEMPGWCPLLTATAAVLGHIFPIYIKFKGGKGVATGLGAVLGIWPVFTFAGLGALGVFILLVLAFRYISVGSMAAAWAFVALTLYVGTSQQVLGVRTFAPWAELGPLVAAAVLFATLILVKHRANIARLRAGTESKVGQKKKIPTNSNQPL